MNRAFALLKRTVVPAVVCLGAAFGLMQWSVLRRIENITLDERMKLRARMQVAVPADDITVLGIDELSIRDIGQWPWNREVHGHLMELLSRVRPAVVSWDILFTEESPADNYFARAIRRNRSVVLGAMRGVDTDDGMQPADARQAGVRLEPLEHIIGDKAKILAGPSMDVPAGILGQVAETGFVDTPPDEDGVRRRAPLLVRVGDEVYPSLSLRTLMEYWAARPKDVTVRLGDAIAIDAPLAKRRIPIDESGAYTINYRHTANGLVQRGYSRLLTELTKRYEKKEPVGLTGLTGRMLLVGQMGEGLTDFGPTPLAPLTPLVLIHANVIENVLRQDYVHVFPPWIVWSGALVLSIVGLAVYSERRPGEQAVFALGAPAAFVAVATLGWINGSWIVPIVGPVLGFTAVQVVMVGRRMIAEMRAKEQIKGMFGTYVSPELVRRLVAAGRQPELGGIETEITAFFSDIESFSTFSEVLSPSQLVELMNEYLTACTDIIQAEGGTLDKYIGDAIVAMYGAPVELPDHAYRACVSVLRVQQRLEELRAKWAADGTWPELVSRLRTRIGLNTGRCVIGNMGSRTRFNYTMMGDNVNLAARMESGAKQWGTYAMCTESTSQACGAHAGDRVVFRPLGRIRVKGRAAAVPIFEIAGFKESLPPTARECFGQFGAGLDAYYARDWDRAEKHFRASARLEPLATGLTAGAPSNPSLKYLELVAQLRGAALTPEWDGVYVMKDK